MDPSSSNSNSEQRGSITYMDHKKIEAALVGNIDAFKDYSKPLEELVTPNKNTVLHVYLTNYKTESTEFVKHILDICPLLLKQANIKGETPLHIAAKRGHVDQVKFLIKRAKVLHEDLESGIGAAKEMMRMTNKDKETALHEAVRHNHVGVVKVLIAEYPDFSYSANDYGETPIYMAAVGGYLDIVVEILENCTSKTYGGPNGKTALHAAVIRDDKEMTRKILEETKTDSLTREADQNGWTPLHYASGRDQPSICLLLLKYDRFAAYIPDRDGKIPLHVAVSEDYGNVVLVLLSICPDCCELVDKRGKTVFHFAMENRKFWSMYQLSFHPLIKNVVNEKDFEGNTPLHLLANSFSDKDDKVYLPDEVGVAAVNKRNQSATDIVSANKDLPSWKKGKILRYLREHGTRPVRGNFMEDYTRPFRVNFMEEDARSRLQLYKEEVCNLYNENVVSECEDDFRKSEKATEYHLVVAALITTVTFAAAFTVPGGNTSEKGPDEGTAVLLRSSAFKAFVITDALAMVSSTSAVFIHFVMALRQYKEKNLWIFIYTILLTIFAMGAMVIAFVTGTYAVLGPSPGLAIVTCLIGLSFFIHPVVATSIRIREW